MILLCLIMSPPLNKEAQEALKFKIQGLVKFYVKCTKYQKCTSIHNLPKRIFKHWNPCFFEKENLKDNFGWNTTGPEGTNGTGHGTTDWFQEEKGACQGCILSPCLFNLYAEYIMRNAELEETQAGIKIARRNISNLRYADDTNLMTESEEELKNHLIKVKKLD